MYADESAVRNPWRRAAQMEYRALPHDATDSGGRVTYIGSSKVSHRAHVRSLEVVRPSPPKAGSSKRKPGTGIGALELQAWVPGEVADAALVGAYPRHSS